MRQIAIWMDTWNNGSYPSSPIPQPPIGVPVPVKTNQAQQNIPPAQGPQARKPQSDMLDLSIFETN